MTEVLIKKYWAEENTLFYVHFQDCKAVRQIEVTPARKVFLSDENPEQEECTLYDSSLDDLRDIICQSIFDEVWNKC